MKDNLWVRLIPKTLFFSYKIVLINFAIDQEVTFRGFNIKVPCCVAPEQQTDITV